MKYRITETSSMDSGDPLFLVEKEIKPNQLTGPYWVVQGTFDTRSSAQWMLSNLVDRDGA